MITEKQRQELNQAMNDRAQEHAQNEGGYPDDFDIVGEHLVGAKVSEEGEPSLYTKGLEEATKLFNQAKKMEKKCEDLDLFDCMYEVGL